jgi:hypothetical protein
LHSSSTNAEEQYHFPAYFFPSKENHAEHIYTSEKAAKLHPSMGIGSGRSQQYVHKLIHI